LSPTVWFVDILESELRMLTGRNQMSDAQTRPLLSYVKHVGLMAVRSLLILVTSMFTWLAFIPFLSGATIFFVYGYLLDNRIDGMRVDSLFIALGGGLVVIWVCLLYAFVFFLVFLGVAVLWRKKLLAGPMFFKTRVALFFSIAAASSVTIWAWVCMDTGWEMCVFMGLPFAAWSFALSWMLLGLFFGKAQQDGHCNTGRPTMPTTAPRTHRGNCG
jgi:hypothetical protein